MPSPLTLWAAPSPSPSPRFQPDDVTPGVIGFVVFAVIAVVTVLLIVDMVRRIRRVNARSRARERIAAELASAPDPDDTDPGDAPPDERGASRSGDATRSGGPTGPAAR